MKPGRNDPCPCGSGKKFKHCCLLSDSAPVADLTQHAWHRMRDALGNYVATLLDFTLSTYGREALQEAWIEFKIDENAQFIHGDDETGLFFPWFFHHWSPHAMKGNTLPDKALQGVPPSRAYLQRKGRQLNPLLQRYLEACLNAPFAFFEVLDCEKELGFTARDVFTGKEVKTFDRSMSRVLNGGDILYGQIVQLQGFAMMEATAPFTFPPAYKMQLLQVKGRKELRDSPDLALRGIYHSLADAYRNPLPPKIHNTDGEPMEPRTLHFDIDSPQAAFDTLKSLALGMTEEELRDDARLDAQGDIVEAMVPWIRKASPQHAAMETVLIARLRIDGRKLTAEVNSMERARAVRSLLEERLGASVRYRRTRKQPLETMMPPSMAAPTSGEPQVIPRNAEEEALMQSPEVQTQLKAFLQRHYESWVDTPLPALQGLTPLQAVKGRDGREMVGALVMQIERDSRQLDSGTHAEVFQKLRMRLGL